MRSDYDPDDVADVLGRLSQTIDHLEALSPVDTPQNAHRQLKALNGRIWRVIRSLEAARLEEWYDTAQLMRDLVPHLSPDGSATEVWIAALEAGALELRPGKLLALAQSVGIDVERYRTETP